MPVTSLLEKTQNLKLSNMNPEPDWILYAKDHRDAIIANSKVNYINHVGQYHYNFRLRALLHDKGYHVNTMWIVQFINNIKNEEDFVYVESILLPDLGYLNTLYTKYKSYITHYRKIK